MGSEPNLDRTQLSKLVDGISIPSQPLLLQKVNELVRAQDPDLNAIAEVVSADVGLSAAVLRTINSPFFGMRQRISSIHHATSLLGLKNVVNLVTSFSLRAAMDGAGMRMERFWDAATDTAQCCAAVARELRVGSADEAYTLGLFHDIGIPLLSRRFKSYIEVLKLGNRSEGRSLTEVEEEHLDTNHAVVGYYMAKSWRLPDAIAEAILRHHELGTLGDDDLELAERIAVLAVAEQIAHHHRRATDNFEWDRVGERALGVLCLDAEQYEELYDVVGEMLAQ